MATIKWRLKGKWVKNCNCAPGCPCDFWALPTHRSCEGMFAMLVEEGHFGKTKMNGVKFAAQYRWPGPIHEGNGTAQPILDEKTTAAQREAILQIMSGKAGNTWFEVLASVITTVLPPKIAPIHVEHDLRKRKARVVIPGILETVSEPIKNLATGGEHRIRVNLPGGMEYKMAEIAQATVNKGMGAIAYDWPGSHSSMAHVEQTHAGLVR